MYLAVVMDLYSRRIVGWHIDKRMTTELGKRKIKGVLLSPWLICQTVIFMIGDHHADKTKNSETNLLAQTPHGSQCLWRLMA
jgi:predicted membrane protein